MEKCGWWAVVVAVCAAAMNVGPAVADNGVTTQAAPGSAQLQARAVREYWTEERMNAARARPIPRRVVDPYVTTRASTPIDGDPGVVAGQPPGGDSQPARVLRFPKESQTQSLAMPMDFAAAPTNPLSGPYGPFQRFVMHGKYNTWPRYIHGKLFYTLGGSDYVCSGTVINRSTVATAGHCVSDGAGTLATNFLFCPAYYQGGELPGTGCWSWVSVSVSDAWHLSEDLDYDYACLVTNATGTQYAGKIGDLTGWAGRAFNWDSSQATMSFGYPSEDPFPGNVIVQVAGVEWYTEDMTAGGQVSKYIGSDINSGSSGGGWFLSWRHPSVQYPDTDGSDDTDPLSVSELDGPFINGVNSHKRCLVDCAEPPTATNGLYWQEMGSPPFRDTAAAGESEDVFDDCLVHTNNNP